MTVSLKYISAKETKIEFINERERKIINDKNKPELHSCCSGPRTSLMTCQSSNLQNVKRRNVESPECQTTNLRNVNRRIFGTTKRQIFGMSKLRKNDSIFNEPVMKTKYFSTNYTV